MALTPINITPRPAKKTGWDVVAQAMSLASTAASIGKDAKALFSSDTAKDAVPPTSQPPAPAAAPAPAPQVPGPAPIHSAGLLPSHLRRYGVGPKTYG